MKDIKYALYLLGLGMALVAYAHANFATKGEIREGKEAQLRENDAIIKRLDRIESKLDRVIER